MKIGRWFILNPSIPWSIPWDAPPPSSNGKWRFTLDPQGGDWYLVEFMGCPKSMSKNAKPFCIEGRPCIDDSIFRNKDEGKKSNWMTFLMTLLDQLRAKQDTRTFSVKVKIPTGSFRV